jgi:hypothetical protein
LFRLRRSLFCPGMHWCSEFTSDRYLASSDVSGREVAVLGMGAYRLGRSYLRRGYQVNVILKPVRLGHDRSRRGWWTKDDLANEDHHK